MANNKPVGIFFEDPDLKTGWAIEGTAVTATAAQLNSAGSTAPATAGTVEASKAVVVDSNKDASAFRNVGLVNLDAGSSGTAGSVDIFPTTASKGKIALTATANTNNDTLSITNAAMGQATTLTIPDPGSAAASLVLTEGNQTINGTKTIPTLVTTNLDAGASGTAGTVDIFPATASKGKIAIAATNNTNNDTTTITNAAMGQASTLTIPDPGGAAANFVLSEGAATINGAKTFGGAGVFSNTLGVTGVLTPTGGVAAAGGFTVSPRNWHTGNQPPLVSTDGTDTTPAGGAGTTVTFWSEVFVPVNATLTGVAIFNGSAASGNMTVQLADSTGAVIAAAKSASTAQSGTDAYQRIPFAVAYAAKGPATYYVGVQFDNNTARVNTHTFGNFGCQKVTNDTYGTLTNITPAGTFTTATGAMASLY